LRYDRVQSYEFATVGASGLKFFNTHHFSHLGKSVGRGRTCALRSDAHRTAQIFVVGLYVEYALAYGGSDRKNIFGQLLLEVSIADGAVGVCLTEVLHDFRSRCQLQQRE